MATAKANNAKPGGSPAWLVFSSGLVAGLVLGVLVMTVFGGPGSAPRSGAPAPVTPAPQQQGPDRIKLTRDIAQLEDIVKQDPGNYQAWVQLGNDLFDIQEPRRSVEAYRKALAIKGTDANVWTDMGVMYRDLKDYQQAIASFRKAMEIDPNHRESRLNLGVVYLHDLNDYPAAIEAWEEFLRVEPTGERADGIREQLVQMRQAAAGQTDLDQAAVELQKKLDAPAGR